jgi:hypothetical protein
MGIDQKGLFTPGASYLGWRRPCFLALSDMPGPRHFRRKPLHLSPSAVPYRAVGCHFGCQIPLRVILPERIMRIGPVV